MKGGDGGSLSGGHSPGGSSSSSSSSSSTPYAQSAITASQASAWAAASKEDKTETILSAWKKTVVTGDEFAPGKGKR